MEDARMDFLESRVVSASRLAMHAQGDVSELRVCGSSSSQISKPHYGLPDTKILQAAQLPLRDKDASLQLISRMLGLGLLRWNSSLDALASDTTSAELIEDFVKRNGDLSSADQKTISNFIHHFFSNFCAYLAGLHGLSPLAGMRVLDRYLPFLQDCCSFARGGATKIAEALIFGNDILRCRLSDEAIEHSLIWSLEAAVSSNDKVLTAMVREIRLMPAFALHSFAYLVQDLKFWAGYIVD
jgi:hypothetical protein